jgi:hypothetical protein
LETEYGMELPIGRRPAWDEKVDDDRLAVRLHPFGRFPAAIEGPFDIGIQ